MEKLATSSENHQHKSRRQSGHQPASILSLPRTSSTSLSWSTVVKDAETGESLEIRPRHWELNLPRPVDYIDKIRTEISTYVPRQNQSNKRIEGGAGEGSEWQSCCYPDGGEGSLLGSRTPTTRERLWHAKDPENQEGTAADVDVDEWGEYMNISDRVRDFGIGRPGGSISDHILLTDEEKEHEPDTPRPTELLHSPVWIPVPREYPLVDHAPNVLKQTAWKMPQGKEPCPSYKNSGYEEGDSSVRDGGRSPSEVAAYRKQRMVTSFTKHLRPKNVQNVPRDGEPVKPSVTTPPSSADVALPGSSSLRKVGNAPKDETIRKMPPAQLTISGFYDETAISDVVRDDVRHKLLYRLQKTRDRYLR